ncbi:hypothetical protein NLJ89_g7374 [Agrocybe chaxingu]|uniref:Uncharacterized protein n=1 Tax=Agrocybe chaxingu TaxID=84603 RepID=A0A9W8MRT9_9AGAR|nr:hypothetical protein NLJ89_g7374 [Agrocybe chaxingu]
MGSICLSSASILRCASLTRLHNILLIIPTILELIFATALIFIKWGSGRRHLLLSAEGWIYFILALVELLSDVLPAVRDDLPLFRAFDVGIGVASFLPVFFYTFFLFLFTSGELVESLPRRIRNVAKLALILFVPAIVIFNEVASFMGVSIRTVQRPGLDDPVVAIGFTSKQKETLWAFFTSTTLALLTAFQASVFCFAFFRLFQAITHQRRIEAKDEDKAHLIKGIGWISAGAKLGALETVVGFAGGGFGVVMTRRLMRMLSRACLIIGIVKGVDIVEDFRVVSSSSSSNPRLSTFRELSPTATAFHATPRAPSALPRSKRNTLVKPNPRGQSMSTAPNMEEFTSIKEKQNAQRVTVMYNKGTPTLYMRFSSLNLPSPALIVEQVKSRPPSEWSIERYRSKSRGPETPYAKSVFTIEYIDPPQTAMDEANANWSVDLEKVGELGAQQQLQVPEKAALNVYRQSILSPAPSFNGPFEIVTIQRQTVSHQAAQPQVLKTLTRSGSLDSQSTSMTPISFAPPSMSNVKPQETTVTGEPLTQSPVEADPETDVDAEEAALRAKSMSIRSMPDSLQAVRELASQFPGPPGRRPSSTVYEEDDGSVLDYPPGIIVVQALGSPSQLEHDVDLRRMTVATQNTTSSWGNMKLQRRANARVADPPPSYKSYEQQPIDPFSDEPTPTADKSFSYQHRTPPWEKLTINTAIAQPGLLAPPPQETSRFSPDDDEITAASVLSGLAPFTGMRDDDTPPTEFSTALDTGKSRQLKSSRAEEPYPTPTRKSLAPSSYSKQSGEKLERVAQWVDTSASVEDALEQAAIEAPAREQQRRDNDLQNLHDRGKSIDNLIIPWLKHPDDERKIVKETNAQITRVKSVGKAPRKSTPTPTRSGLVRGSLHLQPLVIPPRNDSMPEAVQVQVEYGSVESTLTGKGVLRDSEVLGMEDAMHMKQIKQGNYI